MAFSYEPGTGKSFALKYYASQQSNVFYVGCEEYFKKKTFLQKILQAMGLVQTGIAPEMVDTIVFNLRKIDKPLIIIDEFDKLNDKVMQIFKTLYNQTEELCGFILCGAPYFRERIEKGARANRQCYVEIYSRIGRNFLQLRKTMAQDVKMVCEANGVKDAGDVAEILQTSQV